MTSRSVARPWLGPHDLAHRASVGRKDDDRPGAGGPVGESRAGGSRCSTATRPARSLTAGLGFSRADRDENVRRIGYVADLLSRNGVDVVCAVISPFRDARDEVRARHAESTPDAPDRFVEVWVSTPVDVCAERDVKGLYARQRAGEITGLTGVDDPYEAPHAARARAAHRRARPRRVRRPHRGGARGDEHASTLTDADLAAHLRRTSSTAPADEIVRWAVDTFGDALCLAASMADAVLIDVATRVHPSIEVVFLDTQYHFPETLDDCRAGEEALQAAAPRADGPTVSPTTSGAPTPTRAATRARCSRWLDAWRLARRG